MASRKFYEDLWPKRRSFLWRILANEREIYRMHFCAQKEQQKNKFVNTVEFVWMNCKTADSKAKSNFTLLLNLHKSFNSLAWMYYNFVLFLFLLLYVFIKEQHWLLSTGKYRIGRYKKRETMAIKNIRLSKHLEKRQ